MDNPEFVRQGMVWVPARAKAGPKPKKTFYAWTPANIKHAHSLFFAGDRTVWVREGERLYQRGRKRVQRSRMSRADMAWAERNAVAHSWHLAESRARVANNV